MVAASDTVNFTAVMDELIRIRPFTGPHASALTQQLRARTIALMSGPDTRYVPAFKILELLAALTDITRAIADEPHLRLNEATALLREYLSESTPLIHQFHLDAALERARYEPMMLAVPADNPREQQLRLRWASMRAAHQTHEPLPDAFITAVDDAVDAAIAAPEFSQFRLRPLLQCFTEMLATARALHDAGSSLEDIIAALAPTGKLWRRYALKKARYRETPPAPPAFPNIPTVH